MKEGEKKLSHRNKLILTADSSEEGWEVVNEYQRRDPADDSDNDRRIRQAESRASQKPRRAQSAKKDPVLRSRKLSSLPVPPLTYVIPSYGSSVSSFHSTLFSVKLYSSEPVRCRQLVKEHSRSWVAWRKQFWLRKFGSLPESVPRAYKLSFG